MVLMMVGMEVLLAGEVLEEEMKVVEVEVVVVVVDMIVVLVVVMVVGVGFQVVSEVKVIVV